MTNLTDKFTALQDQMTTQHDALLEKLAEMRGEGPENTLKSVNQSIWNLVGPAPGNTLVDIHALLSKINNGIGGFPDGWTAPGGIELLSARELLGQINTSAAVLSLIFDATGYDGNETLLSTLSQLLLQFNTSVVYPTMKNLLMTISQQQEEMITNAENPMAAVPVGICESPITSSGVGFVAIGVRVGAFTFGAPVTVASWDTPPLPFYLTDDPQNGSYGISVDEWSNWKIYVASTALKFGALAGAAQRFDTNEWITLSGNATFRFFVDGEEDIKVYICGASDPALGDCPSAAQDPLSVSAWHKNPNLPWYAAALAGGASWTTNASMMIEGTIAQDGFVITADGDVDMCVAWDATAEPTVTSLGLHGYYEGFPGQWSDIGLTGVGISIATYGAHASTVITLTGLNTAPYELTEVVFVPYLLFSNNHQFPPDVSFQISYLPPGWNAS